MKTVLKYTAGIFLSLVILIASGGFTFSRMVCIESRYTKYALSEQGDCCGMKNLPPLRVQKPCCDIANQLICVDDYMPSFYKTLKADMSLVALFAPVLIVTEHTFCINFPQYISSIPPPLGGVDLLCAIHKFTV